MVDEVSRSRPAESGLDERLRSERGAAIISAIYVMIILTIMGFGVMALSSNDGRMVAQERKTNQALTIAESALDYMVYRFTIPNSPEGASKDFTSGASSLSVDQALTQGMYLAYDVRDSGNAVIGKAQIVVQEGSSADSKRITTYGRYCLDQQCTQLSAPRAVQAVAQISVPESAEITAAFNNLMYIGKSSSAFWMREAYFEGDLYFQKGTTLEFDHQTKLVGKLRSHEMLRNDDCEGDMSQAKVYSFGTIACTYYQEEWPNYNGGNYNANFPEVTVDAPLDRNWYRQNSDKYFPADAKTNNTANKNVIFCADTNGVIYYQDTDFNGTCSSANSRLNDPQGNPMSSGIVFVAGNSKINSGTNGMNGKITFVSAGPNSATVPPPNVFGDLTISGHVYSRNTVSGLGAPSCGRERAGVPGSNDAIGLIANRISLASGCLTVRAAIRSVKGFYDSSSGTFVERGVADPFYFRGAMVIENPPANADLRGEESFPWSMRFIYDPAIATNLPRGMAGGYVPGGSKVTVRRTSYSELAIR